MNDHPNLLEQCLVGREATEILAVEDYWQIHFTNGVVNVNCLFTMSTADGKELSPVHGDDLLTMSSTVRGALVASIICTDAEHPICITFDNGTESIISPLPPDSPVPDRISVMFSDFGSWIVEE